MKFIHTAFARIAIFILGAPIIAFCVIHSTNRLPTEVAKALREADKGTLYSIQTRTEFLISQHRSEIASNGFAKPTSSDERIFLDSGYEILGQVYLDKAKLNVVASAFRSAIWHWNGLTANCFNPRHALRVEGGGHVYDLVLCYECSRLAIYRDGIETKELGAGGSPTALNKILTEAKVPLAP